MNYSIKQNYKNSMNDENFRYLFLSISLQLLISIFYIILYLLNAYTINHSFALWYKVFMDIKWTINIYFIISIFSVFIRKILKENRNAILIIFIDILFGKFYIFNFILFVIFGLLNEQKSLEINSDNYHEIIVMIQGTIVSLFASINISESYRIIEQKRKWENIKPLIIDTYYQMVKKIIAYINPEGFFIKYENDRDFKVFPKDAIKALENYEKTNNFEYIYDYLKKYIKELRKVQKLDDKTMNGELFVLFGNKMEKEKNTINLMLTLTSSITIPNKFIYSLSALNIALNNFQICFIESRQQNISYQELEKNYRNFEINLLLESEINLFNSLMNIQI